MDILLQINGKMNTGVKSENGVRSATHQSRINASNGDRPRFSLYPASSRERLEAIFLRQFALL